MEDSIGKALSQSCTHIEQLKVSQILDGRYFFIPSYQRGYRWTKQQVYDLCNDLLEYVLTRGGDTDSFYSLQPLIVRKGEYEIDGKIRDAYEVIDGQQRLTTLFILYRFLAKGQRDESLQEACKDYFNQGLYHIFYETRPDDYEVLEKLGFSDITRSDLKDIDIAHVLNAFHCLNDWLGHDPVDDPECARVTFELHSTQQFSPNSVKTLLFDLLNHRNTKGSVQFIWYELDENKDAIQEFLSENKGKIRLTDTEKIRALLMQRSNFGSDSRIKDLKQLSIAKDWELIENTLHRNDFWAFISSDPSMEDGRIRLLFEYLYAKNPSAGAPAANSDYLFRHYYKLMADKKHSGAIGEYIESLWNEVMDCYRMLQNWFSNPTVYNLVGLLVRHGCSVKQISDLYDRADVLTNEDFIRVLNQEICREIIDKIPIAKEHGDLDIKPDEEYISLFYNIPDNKSMMPDLFRFINVREINKTIGLALADIDKDDEEKKRSDLKRSARDVMSHIYRFPFEALDVFGWDIEHIDSATTNSLNDPKEQKEWVEQAEEAIGDDILLKDAQYNELSAAYKDPDNKDKNSTLISLVKCVRAIVGEEESDVQKNWIGNLTLLDGGTNRSYKNKIFASKSRIVKERRQAGVFVPVCTYNVFEKNYPGCSKDYWKWSLADKKAYHSYMLNVIKEFKNEFSEKKEESERNPQTDAAE